MKRRTFLSACTAAAAVCTIPASARASAFKTPEELATTHAKTLTGAVREPYSDAVYSVCEMCSSRCAIKINRRGGQPAMIEGNPLSDNATSVCARGGAGIDQLRDKNRLVRPLIRTGERGSGQWRTASWSEALDFAADNLRKIAQKYGPEAVVFSSKAGQDHGHMSNFACAFGSPNIFNHHTACPITYNMVLSHTFGGGLVRDFANAKVVLNFGHNLFEGIDIKASRALAEFIKKPGNRLIVLDPRFSAVADKAHEWLPVRPGTDVFFIMALLHIWLRDGTYDRAFVERYTTGIEQVRAAVAETTPAVAERHTGIAAATIERIAAEIAAAAPRVIIDWGHKTTTTRAEYQRTRAIAIANALMGNYEQIGGIYKAKNAGVCNAILGEQRFATLANPAAGFKVPKTRRCDGAGEKDHPKFGAKNYFLSRKAGSLTDLADAILADDELSPKAWVNTRFNYLMNVANVNRSREAVGKLEFIMSIDVAINDFSAMADVIFPECSYLERDEAIMGYGDTPGYYMRNRACEPVAGALSGFEIWLELAKRLGFADAYPYKSMREYRMQQARGNAELLEALVRDGMWRANVAPFALRDAASCAKFAAEHGAALDADGTLASHIKIPTPSGKIELFSAQVEEIFPGEGCINTRDADIYDGYELALTSGKTPIHTNAHTQFIPALADLHGDSALWIHPQAAAKRGIANGDLIEVYNAHGSQKTRAFVSDQIRPDTVFVYHGFGHRAPNLPCDGVGMNDSVLLGSCAGRVCRTMITNIGVEVKKA